MKVGVVIQARMGSTRLPGKVSMILPNGLTILGFLIERMKLTGYKVIVATSESRQDEKVVEIAKKHKVSFYRGSEEDVLKRYFYTAVENSLDIIVRVTSDNPFTDPECVKKVVSAIKDGYDYAQGGWHYGWFPGTSCEAFNMHALKIAFNNAFNKSEREHVTPFFKERPDLFKTVYTYNSLHKSGYFLTLDYMEDFEAISKAVEEGLTINASFREITAFCEKNSFLMKELSRLHKPFSGVYYNLDVNSLVYTGGNTDIGFGHIIRSLRLMQYLRKMGVKDTWSGIFSKEAMDFLKEKVVISKNVNQADVLIYDITPDPYNWIIQEKDIASFNGKYKLYYNVSGIESTVELFSKEFIPVSSHGVDFKYLPISEWVKNCRVRKSISDVKKVLIYAGAWKQNEFISNLARYLKESGLEAVIHLSPLYSKEFVETLKAEYEVFQNVENMCEVVDKIDAVIASYGNFSFEIASLGIPVAVFNFKDAQIPFVESAEKAGVIFWIGSPRKLHYGKLRDFLMENKIRQNLNRNSAKIDFWGIYRIANEIAWDINEKLLKKVSAYG